MCRWSAAITREIQLYIEEGRPQPLQGPTYRLFISANTGKPLDRQSLYIRVKRLVSVAGLTKRTSTHTLRHSIATHLLQNGMKLERISEFLGHSCVDSTQLYTHLVKTFTDWLAAEQLDARAFSYNELLDFIQYLQSQGKSRKTIQHPLGIVRHYCNYLTIERERNDNPAAGVFMKGIIRRLPSNLLSWEEMEELYRQYSKQLNVPLVSKVILGLLIYQGLAAEEITRLEAVHVHLREGRLFIRAMKRTGERWLPLSALQLIELGEYMQENRLKTGPLLVTGRKQRISPTNINNRMQQMMKQLRRLNPRVINAAQFRSSVIAHWLKANNLRQVQYMAGHKYVSSTQRYQRSTLDDLKGDLQKHHPMS